MMTPRIRVECLKLAVQMCCTAAAFDRPDDVLKLAQRFEDYCAGHAEETPPVDPGRQMPGDPPADPPAALAASPPRRRGRARKTDMERYLR